MYKYSVYKHVIVFIDGVGVSVLKEAMPLPDVPYMKNEDEKYTLLRSSSVPLSETPFHDTV